MGELVLTEAEAAEMLRVKPSQVRAMGRRRQIVRVPPMRPPRYLRSSVERLLCEGYDVASNVQSDGQAQAETPPPWRGDRRPAAGPLACEAVGGGGALHRQRGPQADDVVVRRVPR